MTAEVDSRALFDAIQRVKRAPLTPDDVLEINRALGLASDAEPRWLIEARKDVGLKEIPGKDHAPRIINMLKLVRYPFSDDETAWCGTAMAAWFTQAGIAPPPQGYRALNWSTWGIPCAPQLGAVGVKRRSGGNHVFLIVGITADRQFYKALGANQSNAVTIMDIAVADTFAVRWPKDVPLLGRAPPVMARGTISRNEA